MARSELDPARIAVSGTSRDAEATRRLVLSDGDREHPLTRLMKDLLEAKQDWEATFDALVDPVLVVDLEGRATRCNLALATALGRPVQTLKAALHVDLLGTGESPLGDPIVASLQSGIARTCEARFPRLAGLHQVTTSPLLDGDGRPRGAVVILKDVTEIKEQREQMMEASRLADIGALAAGIAHEINTPLASMSLRAESLLRAVDDPALVEQASFRNFPRYLRGIDHEIQRCKAIVGSLLTFAHQGTGIRSPTDLNGLLQGAVSLVEPRARLRDVEIQVRIDPQLPTVTTDQGQIRQALLALLIHATESARPGGRLDVETRPSADGGVLLVLRDDGADTSKDDARDLFMPFFATRSLRRAPEMGLNVCRRIVGAHGGSMKVESEGGRTRVTFELPPPARDGARDPERADG